MMKRFFSGSWLLITLGIVLVASAAGNMANDLTLAMELAQEEARYTDFDPVWIEGYLLDDVSGISAEGGFESTPAETFNVEDQQPDSNTFQSEISQSLLESLLSTPVPGQEISEEEQTASDSPRPTSIPRYQPEIPQQLWIPSIKLDAPVMPATKKWVEIRGKQFVQWQAPDGFFAGWHADSARLGELGNTVLNGHHNIEGKVFRYLINLEPGDTILLKGENRVFSYVITEKKILPEWNQPLEVRMENARWILPYKDERLTLVTCWPYESNTHRLILVATPNLGDSPEFLIK